MLCLPLPGPHAAADMRCVLSCRARKDNHDHRSASALGLRKVRFVLLPDSCVVDICPAPS